MRDGREFRVFVLAPAAREDVLHKPNAIDSAIARQELDRQGLMKAPVEGDASYRSRITNATLRGDGFDSLRNPFMHVVSPGGADGGGLVAHRGVLQGTEYVDADVLRKAVEEELGYTYEQIRSVYRQGPLGSEKRRLRSVIDARMLALRRSGANMAELGRAIGFPIKASGNCAVLDNAIARAKANSQWFKGLAAQAVGDA
jgi:hypothetical protein